MDISIVIVSYNVKFYLEQCLNSVTRALCKISGEVYVVDNCSVDGSCQMVKEKFPWVKLIENTTNQGFSKANNQAIRRCKGRYILLLNPDTLIQEDSLEKVVEFCDKNSNIGGLGVKMIDGNGRYLSESKRSLPTPLTAFYKIFGLASLFPHSKIFSSYNLGYLNRNENHKIEIMAGAFMLLRKEAIDKTGPLDEDFFMYGEDIDLSYRIIKAGYDNFYYAGTTIIHYKGKSTKKASINYVMLFYRAMLIFAQKHFSARQAKLLTLLIKIAIYFRAVLGIFRRVIQYLFLPVVDFTLIFTGFILIVPLWSKIKFDSTDYYPDELFYFIIPAYIIIWLMSGFFYGIYEKQSSIKQILRSVVAGSVIILLIYAVLPEQFRFSRALIVFGSVMTLFALTLSRIFTSLIFSEYLAPIRKNQFKRIVLIGTKEETLRVHDLLRNTGVKSEVSGRISIEDSDMHIDVLGHINQIDEIVKINKIDQIIFCSRDLSISDVIEVMLSISELKVEYKIASLEKPVLIGNSILGNSEDLFMQNINSLSHNVNKRKKRMFDIIAGIVLLIFSPVLVLFNKDIKGYFRNCFRVIRASYTWVGMNIESKNSPLSKYHRKGIFAPCDYNKKTFDDAEVKKRLNISYAKNYKIRKDLKIVIHNLNFISKTVE